MPQRERAEEFHRLHAGDKALVLVNAWDAAIARLFEQAGSPAIATTSAGLAWSLGYADGAHSGIGQTFSDPEQVILIRPKFTGQAWRKEWYAYSGS